MKKLNLDFNEIILTAAEISDSPFDFLRNIHDSFKVCAPSEADWINSFLGVYSKSLEELTFNRNAPFMWSHLIHINNNVFSVNSMIKTIIASNHFYWKKLFFQTDSIRHFPYLSYSGHNELSKLDKKLKLTFLVYKYNQPTGAHLTPKSLDRCCPNIQVFDVFNRSAVDIFDTIKNSSAVVFNSMQLTDLWNAFDELVKLLSSKEHSINWLTIYFHEPVEKILKYVESSRFEHFLSLSANTNISLSFLTDHDRDLVANCLRRQGQISNLKLHTLANIISFSSNQYDANHFKVDCNMSDISKSKDNIFLTIGSVQSRKGFDFIRILAKDSLRQNSSSYFVWLGMPNRYSLDDWTDIPTNFLFLGYIREDYKWFIMHYSTAVIVSSESEPYSLVASEAIVCGRPVLYRKGRCGLLDSLLTLQPNIDSIFALDDNEFSLFFHANDINQFFNTLNSESFWLTRRYLLSIMNPTLYLDRLQAAIRHRRDCSAYENLSLYRVLVRNKSDSTAINWQKIFSK